MRRRLLLVLSLLLLCGCEGAVRDPVGLGSGGNDDGVVGGGGGGSGSSALLGSWEATFIFRLSSDVQRHTTNWIFRSDGTCHRSVEVYSVLEDRTLTTSVNCTFAVNSGEVAVTYEGSPGPVTFRWSLEGFSPDRLVLDGVAYDRLD